MEHLATRIAEVISNAKRRVVVSLFAAGFLLLYGPLTISLIAFDRHLHWVDTLSVVFAALRSSLISSVNGAV